MKPITFGQLRAWLMIQIEGSYLCATQAFEENDTDTEYQWITRAKALEEVLEQIRDAK